MALPISVPQQSPQPWTLVHGDRIPAIASFFAGLSPVETRARFAVGGPGAAEWLLEKLASDPRRGVITARVGDRVVAVLDHAHAGCGIELGIVVAAAYRRLGIASAMFASLIEHARACREPLIAHANRANLPAVGFLIRSGFAVRGGTFDARLFVKQTR